MHSGRQLGGVPKYSGRQEQETKPLLFLHAVLLPHGFGMHGLYGTCSSENKLTLKPYIVKEK